MPSDGPCALEEQNSVLTLVHSLWTQKMTACSQEGIECSADWESGCPSTSAPAGFPLNRQRYKSFPLERKHARLQGGGTTLHQFWFSLLSLGRCASCNFRDSSHMKRHQSWKFSSMFFKNNLKEFVPLFPTFLMPYIKCNTFKWQQVIGDSGNLPVLNEENHFFHGDHCGTKASSFLIYLSLSTALGKNMLWYLVHSCER